MFENSDDKNINWDKILSNIDGDFSETEFTEEELSALAAHREMKARLAKPEFSVKDGWQRFLAERRKKHVVRLMRFSAAAIFILAIGAAIWFFQPKGVQNSESTQIADKAPSEKVQLKLADGRILELGEENQTIQAGSDVQITAGSSSIAYQGGKSGSEPMRYDTLIIPRGYKFSLQLSDGTTVWLNSATKLSYPAVFKGNTREVYVEGEAFFEVKSNTSKPFIVHAGNNKMTVLGTSFNINTFDVVITTTLATGRLLVSAGEQERLLEPGEQSVYSSGVLSAQKVDIEPYIAWKNGDLLFYDASLKDITRYLARTFDYDFEFEDSSLETLRFTLDMPVPANLQIALDIISKGLDIHFQVHEKNVRVIRSGK